MRLIRTLGNTAAHTGKKVTSEQAMLCLENLYYFLDFVACCYGGADFAYTPGAFDPSRVPQQGTSPAVPPEVDLDKLLAENAALREELTARRAVQRQNYVPRPLDLSEYATRKICIDAMLLDVGWTEGRDWLNEVELPGMPRANGKCTLSMAKA